MPSLIPLDKLTEKTCNNVSFIDLVVQTKFISRTITATRLFRTLFIIASLNSNEMDQNDSNLDKKLIPVPIIYHFFQIYQTILEKFQTLLKNEVLCHVFSSNFSSLETPQNNLKNMKICYGMSRTVRFYDGNESHLGRLFITEKCVLFGMTTFIVIFDHDEITEISVPEGESNTANLNITISKPNCPDTVFRFYFGRNADAKIWEGYFQSLRAMREMEKNRRKLSITEAMENTEEEANLLLICMALNKMSKLYSKSEIVNPLRFYG